MGSGRRRAGFVLCVGFVALWGGAIEVACGESFTAADCGLDGAEEGSRSDTLAPPDRGAPDGATTDTGGPRDARGDSPRDSGSGACADAGDLQKDDHNCGACRHVCAPGPCVDGRCPVSLVAMNLTNPESVAVVPPTTVLFSAMNGCLSPTMCTSGAVYRGSTSTVVEATIASTFAQGIPLVTDGTDVYWASFTAPGFVHTEPVGGGVVNSITPVSVDVSWVALAIDDAFLYAGESGGTLYETPTTSPSSVTWSTVGEAKNSLVGLAALHAASVHYAYWIDRTGADDAGKGEIGGFSGSTIIPPIALAHPTGVAAGSTGPVWADPGSLEVQAADFELTGKPTTLYVASGGAVPERVAADPATGAVFWTERAASPGDGVVLELRPGDAKPLVLAINQTNPGAITFDATRVFWVVQGTYNGSDGAIAATSR